MDILTPSSGDDPGSFDHLLGRNTTDTINSAEHWQAMIPPAPDFFRGESDAVEVSPPIWRYCRVDSCSYAVRPAPANPPRCTPR